MIDKKKIKSAEGYFKKDSKTKEIMKEIKGNVKIQQAHYKFLQIMCIKCRREMLLRMKRKKQMPYNLYCDNCKKKYDELMSEAVW